MAATFLGGDGSEYCLYFKLKQERTDSGPWVRLGYKSPVVFERLEFRTDDLFEWRSVNEVVISWDHARVLLNQMCEFVKTEAELRWLKTMKEVTNDAGSLPSSISRVVGDASDA